MVGVVSHPRSAATWPRRSGSTWSRSRPTPIRRSARSLDYGKFKYETQKKENEARKKQKVIEVKEIKMRPNIDEHDYEVKMRAMNRFLEEGDKVKVTLRFRGREMVHQELGVQGAGARARRDRRRSPRSSSSPGWKAAR